MSKKVNPDTVEAIKALREWIKPGDTVYTSVVSVSRSGMSRKIKVFVIRKGEIFNISWHVAKTTERRFDRDSDSVIVNGAGMDMGFELVYTLSSVLYPKGYRVTKRTPWHYGQEVGQWANDGGYALKQTWL